VSVTSLVDRLYNLYLISREDADAVKSARADAPGTRE
jgi:hypothetical protein